MKILKSEKVRNAKMLECFCRMEIHRDGLFDIVEMNMTIKVGDVVIWRHGKSKSKTNLPLGIAGCEVLEIGVAENGEPAAKLKLPSFFAGLHKDAANAYLADLEG